VREDRGVGREVVLALLPVTAAAFVVRTALVALLRRRSPTAAAAVDRWWTWTPLAVVLVAFTFVHPLLGIGVAVLLYLVLTSARAAGSPLRPRRR
jgi:hypothetical protein